MTACLSVYCMCLFFAPFTDCYEFDDWRFHEDSFPFTSYWGRENKVCHLNYSHYIKNRCLNTTWCWFNINATGWDWSLDTAALCVTPILCFFLNTSHHSGWTRSICCIMWTIFLRRRINYGSTIESTISTEAHLRELEKYHSKTLKNT